MSDYDSVADLYDKVDWEGGLVSAILGYGIRAESLPEETPPDIVDAWQRVEAIEDTVNFINEWLETHSDDGREFDD